MRRSLRAVWWLGLAELASLRRDPIMVGLLAYAFTVAIHAAGASLPESLRHATVAVVDQDASTLSGRIVMSLRPPLFRPPDLASPAEAERGLDTGRYTFVLEIPPSFEREVLAGRSPGLRLAVDATRMSQAFSGSGHLAAIVAAEVDEHLARHREAPATPVELALRMRFNPNLVPAWFGSTMELVNMVTLLAVILVGASLIRAREQGVLSQLLSMPVTPGEIVLGTVWPTMLVVGSAAAFSVAVVIRRLMAIPIHGSIPLWLGAAALGALAAAMLAVLLASVARDMPRFALLLVLVLLPLEMLSGAVTPRESLPEAVRIAMLAAPTTHFVAASAAILFRGAGWDLVWPSLLSLLAIAAACGTLARIRFRRAFAAE